MRYSGITKCDICNGNGIGVVLWVQGCDVHCPGCHNPETWDFDSCGKIFTENEAQLIERELEKEYVTRLTLSGGHPLAKQNIDDCTRLLKRIKQKYPNIETWVYTGYFWEDISNFDLLNYVDVIVDGPFLIDRRDISIPFRGSSNQRIIDVKKSLKNRRVIEREIAT